MARLSAFTSSEANEPTRLPKRLLGTAVNLSTIIRHGARSPLWVLGWTASLKIACLRWIGGQRAHDDRIVGVEPIVLDDDRGSRLARIGRSTCDGPDLAAFHSSFHAEIASTNDWSPLA